MTQDVNAARSALRATSARLLKTHHVVATGVGFKVSDGKLTDTPSLICSVDRKLPLAQLSSAERLPAQLDGIPTDVIETGRLRAFQSHTGRHRPAPGGTSIGHRDITAGTFGCLVRRGGEVFILSNNHVLANSNAALAGDPILQPGPHDGGSDPDDRIAELADFVVIDFGDGAGGGSGGGGGGGGEPPSGCSFANAVAGTLNTGAATIGSQARLRAVTTRPEAMLEAARDASAQAGNNLVDAALARPLSPDLISDEILGIGQINGSAEGALGMAVQKSGRTTGYTTDSISQIDVTANVQYGPGQIAQFTDQLIAGPMSQGGDSGSAVLDMDRRLVGLLFAGSDSTTIINRIQHVFTALNVSL